MEQLFLSFLFFFFGFALFCISPLRFLLSVLILQYYFELLMGLRRPGPQP